MATDFNKANLFQLSGSSIQVIYSDTSLLGVPQFQYRDNHISQSFSGQEISIQDTELGRLVTVTLETIPDLRTVTFSLILPLVNVIAEFGSLHIRLPGIKTVTHTTIAGPGLGAEKTYTTVNLRGTARFVVS
jgi:hypothetical protein